jgi:hypothetical protein
MSDHSNGILEELRTLENKTAGLRLQLEIISDGPNSNGALRTLALHWDIPEDDSSARFQAENESALNAVWNLAEKRIDSLNLTGYPYASLPKGLAKLNTTLKTLTIDKCIRLEDMSEIATLRNLETLTISQCDRLEGLPSGIGGLEKLQKLRLCLCNNLHKLPEEMGLLRNLRTLEIDTCQSLRSLPIEISKLRQLELLELEYFDIFSASSTNKIGDFRTCRKRRKQKNTDCSGLGDNSCPPVPFARDDLQDFLESTFPMILRGSQQMIPPELKHFHPKQLRLCGFHRDAILHFLKARGMETARQKQYPCTDILWEANTPRYFRVFQDRWWLWNFTGSLMTWGVS